MKEIKKVGRAGQWSNRQEAGAYWGLKFMLFLYRAGGRGLVGALLYVVISFFFLSKRSARLASIDFLRRVHKYLGDASPWRQKPNHWHSFGHFLSFAKAILDKVSAWTQDLSESDLVYTGYDVFSAASKEGRGVLIIASHLGNVEVCRAIGRMQKGLPITILVHTAHAENFNRLLGEVCPAAKANVLQVTEIDLEMAIRLMGTIENGGHVVMVGDRTPVGNQRRVIPLPFLGEEALFSQGPFLLASLLDCPVLLLFCVKEGKGYHLYFEQFADSLKAARAKREDAMARAMRRYVARLEHFACRYPYQWFNFYPYWAQEALRGK